MEYWQFNDQIKNKEDFYKFMNLLRQDWEDRHELIRRKDGADTKIKKNAWENCYLPDFLEALQAWVDDTSTLRDDFPYEKLAGILSASVMYE